MHIVNRRFFIILGQIIVAITIFAGSFFIYRADSDRSLLPDSFPYTDDTQATPEKSPFVYNDEGGIAPPVQKGAPEENPAFSNKDTDGDGLTDYEEKLGGTDPYTPNDRTPHATNSAPTEQPAQATNPPLSSSDTSTQQTQKTETPKPVITSISPLRAKRGDTVTVYGKNFTLHTLVYTGFSVKVVNPTADGTSLTYTVDPVFPVGIEGMGGFMFQIYVRTAGGVGGPLPLYLDLTL